MDILLAPDVYVNASVALGSAPDQVVQRVLGKHKGESRTTEWVLGRVRSMLAAVPEFKAEAVDGQIGLIRTLVQVVDAPGDRETEDWAQGLIAAAQGAGVSRVVTDHPDLLERESASGVEFLSTEAWLLEVSMPPPAP